MADPAAVARAADWPVNEIDLHARHKWLVGRSEFRERLRADPEYFDAKVAGWWVWGLCQWIGGGWCRGVHSDQAFHLPQQIPNLRVADGASGSGVHASGRAKRGSRLAASEWAQRPAMTGNTSGMGVHAYSPGRCPAMSSAGQAVHLPSLGNDRGINGQTAAPCEDWFLALQSRLRRVRVACGDWTRVLGPSVLGKGKNVGGRRPCAVFLDPPYSHEFRDAYLYAEDDAHVSDRVREWALEHGDDPELRIALCGYEGEHAMPANWQVHAWKAARGYGGGDNTNRERERIWFSPHCVPIDQQPSLFSDARTA